MATLGNPKRYRLTVPQQDTSVQDWLDAQLNISASIRQLIRDDIIKNGYTDVTCRQVEQGAKRGRPTNAELERRELGSSDAAIPVLSEHEPVVPVVEKQTPVQPLKQEPVTVQPISDPDPLNFGYPMSQPAVNPAADSLLNMLDSIMG